MAAGASLDRMRWLVFGMVRTAEHVVSWLKGLLHGGVCGGDLGIWFGLEAKEEAFSPRRIDSCVNLGAENMVARNWLLCLVGR